MDINTLATRAVDILASLLLGTLKGAAATTASDLYECILDRLNQTGNRYVFDSFEKRPHTLSRQAEATRLLVDELGADAEFRRDVHSAVQKISNSFNDESHNAPRVTADRGSIAVGRDMSIDQSQETHKTNFGGVIVGLVAVAVVVAVLILGPKVYNAIVGTINSGGMNGNTTCRDFLRADPQQQAQIMKNLYLDANRPEMAGDPFLVQNAEYTCGSVPNWTLHQLATRPILGN